MASTASKKVLEPMSPGMAKAPPERVTSVMTAHSGAQTRLNC